jgi:hypothetical protein
MPDVTALGRFPAAHQELEYDCGTGRVTGKRWYRYMSIEYDKDGFREDMISAAGLRF